MSDGAQLTADSDRPVDYALRYAAAELSIVPIECDGTKQPAKGQPWKHLQSHIAEEHEIHQLFSGEKGVGIICGKVSGNLETLDIDAPELVESFEAAVSELAPDLLAKLPIVATPRNQWGGRHYRYRIVGDVAGNTKLAQSELRPQYNRDGTPVIDLQTGDQRFAPETLIETRGEGGYALAPGSAPQCHETGLPYKHVAGPELTAVPTITHEEHRVLWHVAKSFNRYVEDREVNKGLPKGTFAGSSPGDDYNSRTTWDDILLGADWSKARSHGNLTFWRRPGKANGISATTGVLSSAGTELFCVFSSNAFPFEGPANGRTCTSYSKFAAYAVLEHQGDFSAAAKELAAQGYGKPNKLERGGTLLKAPATAVNKIKLPEPFIRFPTKLLPSPLREFIREGARAIGCDEALIALPLLAALAGCIGSSRRLRIKPGWCAPSVLWTGAVVDSGQQKSPAQSIVTRSLYERQGRDLAEHNERMIEHQREIAKFENELKDWNKKRADKGDPPDKPEEPTCKRIILSDSTIEAVADRLHDNQRGLLLDRDELSGWLGSYDQYRAGKGSDVSHWLSCYNAKPLLIDRKSSSRKTIFVERAAVSITGGIQPGILKRMLGSQHFENGLAARFGFAMPPKTVKRWTKESVSENTEKQLELVYDSLLALHYGRNKDGNAVPIDLNMTLHGEQAFATFYNEHANEQAELEGKLSALWAKLEEVAGRLALIVHLVRCAANDSSLVSEVVVDATSIEIGVALARWFAHEGRRIYETFDESPEERDLRQAIEIIGRKGGRITARDLSKASRRFADSEVAELALNQLVAAGGGHWETLGTTSRGGRPSQVFCLSVGETPTEPEENRGFGYADSISVAENESGDGAEEELEWTV